MKFSLTGKHIHVNPLTAIENLTAEKAGRIPKNGEHSCWHILHHIVYWQDLMLEALRKKEKVDWPKNNEMSWAAAISDDDKDWNNLVQRFKTGLDEALKMSDDIESQEELPAWPKVPAYQALMVFGQHNAYHIGEIVATRQALGYWPPSPDHKTF
ncbi:MAG: DinB family protein [Candidatus Thorarchaeota archaeon]